MSEDPFARFERSRGGWLLPAALFIFGAIPTAFAVSKIHGMALMQQVVDDAEGPNLDIGEGNPIREDGKDE